MDDMERRRMPQWMLHTDSRPLGLLAGRSDGQHLCGTWTARERERERERERDGFMSTWNVNSKTRPSPPSSARLCHAFLSRPSSNDSFSAPNRHISAGGRISFDCSLTLIYICGPSPRLALCVIRRLGRRRLWPTVCNANSLIASSSLALFFPLSPSSPYWPSR